MGASCKHWNLLFDYLCKNVSPSHLSCYIEIPPDVVCGNEADLFLQKEKKWLTGICLRFGACLNTTDYAGIYELDLIYTLGALTLGCLMAVCA